GLKRLEGAPIALHPIVEFLLEPSVRSAQRRAGPADLIGEVAPLGFGSGQGPVELGRQRIHRPGDGIEGPDALATLPCGLVYVPRAQERELRLDLADQVESVGV